MTNKEILQSKIDVQDAKNHFSFSFRSAGIPDENVLGEMIHEYARRTGFSLPWVRRQAESVIPETV